MSASVALLLSASPAVQAGELFSVEGQAISPAIYETPEPVTTQVNAGALLAALPVAVGEQTYLIPGASYRLEAPRFIDPPEYLPPTPLLHEAELSLGLHRSWGEGWGFTATLGGGLAGDLYALDRGVVRFSGLALAAKELSEAWTLGGGVALTWAFGQLLPVPLLRLRWAPSETLEFDAVLPAHANFTWTPKDRLRLGLRGEIVGNEYAIRDPDAVALYSCEVNGVVQWDPCLDHLAYTDGNVGAFVGTRLVGDLWLDLHAGASLYRRFELLNAGDEPVLGGDQTLAPASFAKLRLAWVY